MTCNQHEQTSDWDEGKGLPVPHVRHHGVDLDDTAHAIVKKHGLSSSCFDKIVDLLVQLQLVQVRLQTIPESVNIPRRIIATYATFFSSALGRPKTPAGV